MMLKMYFFKIALLASLSFYNGVIPFAFFKHNNITADSTPNSLDWADFSYQSAYLAISGINVSINIEVSAVYDSGVPTIEYRKNAGSWTSFTPGSPGSSSFSNGDLLAFRVTGNTGEGATITVTNTSDSNTVLDSVTGSIFSCPGYSEGGYCWFQGSSNQSCDTACSNASGTCNSTGTLNYTGSSGSNANCQSVLDGVSSSGSGAPSTTSNAHGCYYDSAKKGGGRKRGTNTTTCSSSGSNVQRVCACDVTPDISLDSMDWADFDLESAPRTFSGINLPVSIEISVANSTGTPTFKYSKNSATPVTVTTGTPAVISVSNNDTLYFRAEGTPGHEGIFTIKNLTDSSTVIDTVTGTVITCSGTLTNGHCYYLGSAGNSCDTTCAARGGCDLAGTEVHSYSSSECNSILLQFGLSTSGSNGNSSYTYGCAYQSNTRYYKLSSSGVTCAASSSGKQRVCACDGG